MIIGYIRVSTREQSVNLQKDALQKYGCELIFEDIASGASERPELNKAINQLKRNDIFVVWKLDRLGRTLLQLVKLINSFRINGIEFISISDNIDTTTPYGRLYFHLIASFAEFEREITIERTKAGLKSARNQGRIGGRPTGINLNKAAKAKKLYLQTNPKFTVNEILKQTGIKSKSTLYRYLREMGVPLSNEVPNT
jgi:DNA invertase Pin-like site-specific DNA recombinase